MKAEKIKFNDIKPNVAFKLLNDFPKRGFCYRKIGSNILALYRPDVSIDTFIPTLRTAFGCGHTDRVMVCQLPNEVVHWLRL